MKYIISNSLKSTFQFEIPKDKFGVLRKIWVEDTEGNNITNRVTSAHFQSCDLVFHFLSRLAIKTIGNDKFLPFFFTFDKDGLVIADGCYQTQVIELECKDVGHVVLCFEGEGEGIEKLVPPPYHKVVYYYRYVTRDMVKFDDNTIQIPCKYTPCTFQLTPWNSYKEELPTQVKIITENNETNVLDITDKVFHIDKMEGTNFELEFNVPYTNHVEWLYPFKLSVTYEGGALGISLTDECYDPPFESNGKGGYTIKNDL